MAADELVQILNDCSPRYLFFEEVFSESVLHLRDRVESIECYVGMGQAFFPWSESYEATETYPSGEPAGCELQDFEYPQIILYTSGATGFPEGP